MRCAPILLSLALLASCPARAAEGMWQPRQIPELAKELQGRGLSLDPASMTHLTGFPMGAVISLGGCTASFVSPDGLVITNHHCVRGSLQYDSTPERNILRDGFLAHERGEELPAAPGSRVYVTVETTDVTERVLAGLTPDTGGLERQRTIEEHEKLLVEECERDAGHRCSVRAFFDGLHYLLIKRLEILDVRLVYAPADSIGTFGGEVDNWMWPRHTGDFGFYRAWVGPDGKPAEHAADNVPYRPAHWLRIAPEGVSEGDLVMVLGYPGRTRRHALAREVEDAFQWYYPRRVALLEELRSTIADATADRPDAVLRYASTVAGLSNRIKNYEGMIDGFAHGDMLERKRRREAELRAWVAGGGEGSEAFGRVLDGLDAVLDRRRAHRERDLLLGSMDRVAMLEAARDLYRLARERAKPDAEREPGFQQRDLRNFRARLQRLDRRFDPAVDRALFEDLLARFAKLGADEHLPELDAFCGLERGPAAVEAKLKQMYADTRLDDPDDRLAWMEKPAAAFEASDDPFLRLAVALYDGDRAREDEDKAIEGDLERLRPRYMEALIAFETSRGAPVYDDANGTLRMTYGTVRGYTPRDGVYYKPFTTLDGVAEKTTGEAPFVSPPALLRAVHDKDWGRWGVEALGSVPVDFLSTVDTTGGNSGSPTIDGHGNLVGLLFDGTWESIDADWDFDLARMRSIHVDIRYVLWVMDHIDHADHLLSEMGIAPAVARTRRPGTPARPGRSAGTRAAPP